MIVLDTKSRVVFSTAKWSTEFPSLKKVSEKNINLVCVRTLSIASFFNWLKLGTDEEEHIFIILWSAVRPL